MPECVQIAYATLAAYVHRNPVNVDTVIQIVVARSKAFLRENGAVQDRSGAEQWAAGEEQEVDLFSQLARLHALMVYQMIGLLDGDIRLRHIAEGRTSVQNSWAAKLFKSAGECLSDAQSAADQLDGYLPRVFTNAHKRWYLWILAESIRRTWLIAVSISPIYFALQSGWSACPGGVMYTNRIGLWNASSAAEWDACCLDQNVGFLQRFDCARLFADSKPEEFDEFATAMLDMTFNSELLQTWRARNSGL